MIAALRRRHRRAAPALWLLLPAVFLLSGLRPPDPRVLALPPVLQEAAPAADQVAWRSVAEGFELGPVGEGPAQGRLALRAIAPLERPDVLVYWLPAEPAPGDGVPDHARFAGRLDDTRPVAIEPPSTQGGLLVFSLGHQERLAWIPLGARR